MSCTRCERPICPDCMNAAAVGFQCPECVRQGRQDTRAAVTPFGGAVAEHGREDVLTRVLIGINVAVWLAVVSVAVLRGEVAGNQVSRLILTGGITDLVRLGAAVPVESIDGVFSGGIASGELWRLVTAMFLHYGIIHLALNMYGLWLLGQHCEHLLGRWRFLALYLLSGLGGTVAEFLFGNPNAYGAGASGCIFGMMAALFFFLRKLNTDVRPVATLLLLNLTLGFFLPQISLLAHVGGMIIGGAIGAVIAYAPRGSHQTRTQILGICAVGVVLLGLISARIFQYGLWLQ
ncbi:MAG: rhomboid family intramembrane serine protease [Mycobacteriales bacterium]